MQTKYKKGLQLNEAFGAILAVVLIAVLVIVALVLYSSMGTSFDETTAATQVNESVVATTAGTLLLASGLPDGTCGTVSMVLNGTSSVQINSANYTQTGCLLANTTSTYSVGASPTWRVTYPYSYSAPTAATNASSTTITQFATYPALVGLVGTIVFLGIVIGVLVASFVFGRRRTA